MKLTRNASTDNPKTLLNTAFRTLQKATQNKRVNRDLVRLAAEGGWLAICSTADVAAKRLGLDEPGGAVARRQALAALERETRRPRGTFTGAFDTAKTRLHGAIFHSDEFADDGVVEVYLDVLADVIARAMDAIREIR